MLQSVASGLRASFMRYYSRVARTRSNPDYTHIRQDPKMPPTCRYCSKLLTNPFPHIPVKNTTFVGDTT